MVLMPRHCLGACMQRSSHYPKIPCGVLVLTQQIGNGQFVFLNATLLLVPLDSILLHLIHFY